MRKGRADKAIRNSKYAVIYKVLETALGFFLRTIFIKTLSVAYLGLNGVFANILTVLSLMDLGLGSAIAFSLYKPLADNNEKKIQTLMNVYRKLYRNIGIVICCVGVFVTPVLKYIINLPQDIPEIYLIYWLNIANTAASYFWAYKRTILIADQKSYINYKNDMFFKIARCMFLAGVLLLTHNFVLYLLVDIVNTLLSNIVVSKKVSRIYPYLNEKKVDALSKDEQHKLWKYMKAGLLNKIGQTVVNSTDNIIISTYVSTIIVGYYSNYLMIISGIETFTYLLFSNLTASVGNLAASKDAEIYSVRNLFKKITIYSHVLSTIVCVGLFSLINPLMELWVGKELLLSQTTVGIVILNLYITLNLHGVSNFMGAKGELYYYNRFRPIIEAAINLVISVLLVKYTSLGIDGVFIGTTVSFACGRLWMDAHILYKHWFGESFMRYIIDYIKKGTLTIVLCMINFYMCTYVISYFGLNGVVFILLMFVVLILTIVTLFLVYKNTEAFRYLCSVIGREICRRCLDE